MKKFLPTCFHFTSAETRCFMCVITESSTQFFFPIALVVLQPNDSFGHSCWSGSGASPSSKKKFLNFFGIPGIFFVKQSFFVHESKIV